MVTSLKRNTYRFVSDTLDPSSAMRAPEGPDHKSKGNALVVQSIAYPKYMIAGDAPLPAPPPGTPRLCHEKWLEFHCEFCETCRPCAPAGHGSCYGPRLALMLRNGFALPWRRGPPDRNVALQNYAPYNKFAGAANAEFAKMLEGRALEPISAAQVRVISPLLAVVKPADEADAAKNYDIRKLDCDKALSEYNAARSAKGLLAVTPRIVVDNTKSGVNAALSHISFSLCSLSDLLTLVRPGYMITVYYFKRAYWAIPVATKDRSYLGIRMQSKRHLALSSAPFGLSASPFWRSGSPSSRRSSSASPARSSASLSSYT